MSAEWATRQYDEAAAERLGKGFDWRWVRRLGAAGLAGSLLFGGYMYEADVSEVEEMLADTHPYIIENSPVPDVLSSPLPGRFRTLGRDDASVLTLPHRLATVNFPGFGLVDTYRADDVFEPFDRVGANWSIHYDNLGIDIGVIARTIVAQARAENVDEIGIDADSMGNIVATEVAVQIERIAPDITIPYIVMDSPAVGLDVLRPKSRQDGYRLLDSIHLPGAQYSRYARMAAEMYLRLGQIHDPASFMALLGAVHREVFENRDLPANTLLAEQFQLIINADVEGDFEALGRLPEADRPTIVFMGAADPLQDDVVNTPKSYGLIKKWTDQAGLTLIGPYGIKDFYHGAQWRSMKEYHHVLGREIVPRLMALDES